MENELHILQFNEEVWIHLSGYVKYQRPRTTILNVEFVNVKLVVHIVITGL
jgi:hypothetical protein